MVSGHYCVIESEGKSHVTHELTLLERAEQCDAAALGELYDCFAPRIYAYIYRRVGDAHVAEDLVSEVFVRVIQAIQAERHWRHWRTSFQAWLYRIAHNLVVDYYRRQPSVVVLGLDEQMTVGEDCLDDMVTKRLMTQRIRNSMHHLTSDQQQVLALRFGEGMSTREAAEVMDRSVGAIEALQHRALAALRRVLRLDQERGEANVSL